jgi:hypothetical protein
MLSLLTRLFLLGFLIGSPLCAYARPVILSIDASSDDGTQIGTLIGVEVKKNFPDVEKHYDSYLTFLLSPSQFKQLIPQINALKAVIDPAYQAEVNAIAAIWHLNTRDELGDGKLSIDEFWLLQLLPDLTAVNKGSAFAVANRSDNNPIAARNLDWKTTDDLKSLQTISLYHYQDRTLVSIGFAGLVGVISGFNDQGLFVSLIDASERQASNALLPQSVSGFELRNVLKNSHTIALASQELVRKSYSRSHQILLADTENIAVLEQPVGETATLRQTDSTIIAEMPWHNNQQLAVVNCFVLPTSPRNCYASQDYYQWGRFAQLSTAFPEQDLSVSNVVTMMQDQANIDQALFNEDTLQSIVFTPKDRALYFSTEAATQTHEKYPLVEKYQLIKTDAHHPVMEIMLLVLSIVGLVLVWIYIFHGGEKNKPQDTVLKI